MSTFPDWPADLVSPAVAAVRARWSGVPRVGIILGTGLGGLVDDLSITAVLDYAEIPHFPKTTALGHRGRLVCGTLADVPVVAMQGRFHRYEGHPRKLVTLPVRVMHALGIAGLIVSNAAGGVNPQYQVGDVMALCDHIDLMFDGIDQPDGVTSTPGDSPVCGRTIAGPRSPVGMYDARLLQQAARMARSGDVVCHQGVYVAMRGPNYETRAEYRFVRRIGGDAVGMSTVPEVCVASALGLRVLALSAITNVCLPDALGETTGAGVVSAAGKAADGLRRIVRGVVQAWDDRPA